MVDSKGCPFCGGEAYYTHIKRGAWEYRCHGCGVTVMIELKPCPFCGEIPRVEIQRGGDVFVNSLGFLEVGEGRDSYTMLCCCEGKHIACHENRGMAMLAWNRWVENESRKG